MSLWRALPFGAPSTQIPGVNPKTQYAPSSHAANHLVFGNVKDDFENKNGQGRPRLGVSFPDGTSQTILVRSLAANIDRRTWWALVTPAGRDVSE